MFQRQKDDDIPGKIVLSPEVLAEQQKGLEKIAQQLRRERLDKEAEDAITFGFCPRAELWNGRCVCECLATICLSDPPRLPLLTNGRRV